MIFLFSVLTRRTESHLSERVFLIRRPISETRYSSPYAPRAKVILLHCFAVFSMDCITSVGNLFSSVSSVIRITRIDPPILRKVAIISDSSLSSSKMAISSLFMMYVRSQNTEKSSASESFHSRPRVKA